MKENAYWYILRLCLLTAVIWGLGLGGAVAQNKAGPLKVFGLVGITEDQTARIHFTNIAKSSPATKPVWVKLLFLDSLGEVLQSIDYEEISSEPILVQPGGTVSFELDGSSLAHPGLLTRVSVLPAVQFESSLHAGGLATLELTERNLFSYRIAERFSLADILAVGTTPQAPFKLGPVTLGPGYTARLNLTAQRTTLGFNTATLDAHLYFRDYAGNPVGSDSTVHLYEGRTASIEISGNTYAGTLLGLVDFLRGAPMDGRATMEIIEDATGRTVAVMTPTYGSSSGGGGGGGGM